ncbi:hypothetical protein E4T44_06634 [Aureobasidium sp. EXF-8845]|nr:hypothetical protein E4T44_06634 [Aureobasidium sp. EXF-8845]KAI4849987.1 hypothetical protein E4T45_05692 [Aureobasidium sp. EXF-8846]
MSSLLSLPPEICNTIFEEISARDVMNLRRVCRRTNALSSHQFGLKCLADLSFIWSSYSLQGLLDLSTHPLGRYVKRLTFATHFIYSERLTEDPAEQRKARLQDIFVQWDERNKSLVRALENLQRLGVRPILGVYDILMPWMSLDNSDSYSNDRQLRKGYGYEKFYGTVTTEVSYPPFTHTIEYVLKAAQQAKLPIEAFHIHWDRHAKHEQDEVRVLCEQHLFSEPGRLSSDFELLVTLEHIKRIEIEAPNRTSRFLIDTKRQRLELCTELVRGATSIPRNLTPLFDWEHALGTSLPPIIDMDHCFKEIRLALIHTSSGFLSQFLNKQAKTLRVLHLESITMSLYDESLEAGIDVDDTALSFLSMLKHDLSLEYLKMARLSDGEDRSRLIGGHDDTWVGKQAIQDGLQIYIQREEDGEHSVDEDVSDSDEGEWIAVHHSENEEDEHEVWPDTLHMETTR